MLIVGDREAEADGITPRLRSGENLPFMKPMELIERINQDFKERR